MSNLQIGIIGAGVMGQALIKGLLNKDAYTASQLWAAVRTEKSRLKLEADLGALGVETLTEYAAKLPSANVIILAVKPSGLNGVLKQLKEKGLKPETLVISIVSGHHIDSMEEKLGQANPVIRAMPNTPMLVGEAMTVLCRGGQSQDAHMQLAQTIFDNLGLTLELDEAYLDAVTALSGAGPAYIYLMMEALADGGVRVGLPRDVALTLVAQTMKGAAQMVQSMGRHPAALRDDVTTPAGCTIGALLTMEDGKIRSVLARAVEEATQIAGQLGKTT